MKKFKILILLISAALVSFSCDDDGGTSFRFLEDGIVPNMVKDASTDGFIDLIRVNNGENISITFNATVAQGDPSATDIVGYYQTAAGPLYKTTLFSNVSLPSDFTLSASDIVAAFSELSSTDDLKLADVLTITTRFTRPDGVVLELLNDDGSDNFSANIKNSGLFTTVIRYPVSCPSDIGGNYTAVSNGDNTDGQPPAVDYTYDVTLTDDGGGAYTMSDFAGGVYILWYNVYGLTFEQTGVIVDVCGDLTLDFTDAWGQTITGSGTVNPDGTITINWTNPWGDFLETVLTEK